MGDMNKIQTLTMTFLTVAVLTANGAGAAAAPEPVRALSVQVNGKAIQQQAMFDHQQQTVLVPLRPVAESLGFAVTWNESRNVAEIQKGTIWSYAKAGEDGYPDANVMKKLGAKPRLLNGSTYVPLAFVRDIMKTPVAVSGDDVTVGGAAADDHLKKAGTITGVRSDNGNVAIHVNGIWRGVVLYVSADTEIVTEDGRALKPEDLKLGMEVEATHAEVMTMSLPPHTAAKRIVVKNSLPDRVLGTAGELQSVTADSDGTLRVELKGERLSEHAFDTVVLRVTDQTEIVSTDGNTLLSPKDLKQGARVYAFYSPMLTKSLPPIGAAEKIVVEPSE
jgi:hypothetical protein